MNKSLYEILEVPAYASATQIHEAHARLAKSIENNYSQMPIDDYNLKLKILKEAYIVLISPPMRAKYDAYLKQNESLSGAAITNSLAFHNNASDISFMRSQSAAMRAEALALRADALALKADSIISNSHNSSGSLVNSISYFSGQFFKSVFMILVFIFLLLIVIGLYRILSYGAGSSANNSIQLEAADKVFLQEYYQIHGVRPSSRAEAAMLDKERNKRKAETEKEFNMKRSTEEAIRAEQESRRYGEMIAHKLEADQRENERRQMAEKERRKEEERQRQSEENNRIERARDQWSDVLNR
jgi:curved DNA-binding protein CbpA